MIKSWERRKVLTSVPLLPSKMQNIASQHSGLWAEGERERLIWSHTMQSQAEPWSHQLNMIHIPAQEHCSCKCTHIHTSSHSHRCIWKRAMTEPYWWVSDALLLYKCDNLACSNTWLLECLYTPPRVRACMCIHMWLVISGKLSTADEPGLSASFSQEPSGKLFPQNPISNSHL